MTYPWTAGEVLTAADLNAYAGLVFISRTTISGTPSSVTVSSAFSSQFKNYRLVLNIAASSADTLGMRLGASSTGYYWGHLRVSTGGTVTGAGASNDSYWKEMSVLTTDGTRAAIDLYEPYVAVDTAITSAGSDMRTIGDPLRYMGGWHDSATSYTAFTLYTTSGGVTFTNGTIDVYGYNNG